MNTLLAATATLVWLGSGYVAAIHLADTRSATRLEVATLAGALGLVILAGASLLGVMPRPVIAAVAIALAVGIPAYLYRFYRGVLDRALREGRGIGAVPHPPAAAAVPGRADPGHADPRSTDAGPTDAGPAAARGDGDRAAHPETPPGDPERGARRPAASVWPAILLVAAVAASFRFVNLGYSELQGDEARAVLMAHELGRSRSPEILLLHKKGPLEVVLPAGTLRLGDGREGTARLPFAIAGFLGVLAVLALGTRLWGFRAGFVAAMLLAVDGYLIAFARIVQYQSLVFLFSALAVWCAWRFHQRAPDGDRLLLVAGLCLGFGSWAHYEMVFAAPPVAWLALARGRAERWPARTWVRRLAPPALLALAVAAAFYVPFARHPHFAETRAYILERRVGSPPYNMLGDFFQRASFYNASYYVALMGAALVATVIARLRSAWGWAGAALGLAWAAAFGVLVARPAWFAFGPADADPRRSLAILVFLPVAVAVFAAPRVDARWRAVWLWLLGPFFAAGFLVQKPHTHFYTLLPAWALLVGWGVDRGLRRLAALPRADVTRPAATLAGAALVAVFALHQWWVFVNHTPEYKRVFPRARLAGYWQPFGDTPPRGGYFGFPYRAGWNSVRALFEAGVLSGDYDSNEEPLITGWYTAGAPRCAGRPRYHLVAWNPQDAVDLPLAAIERDYHPHTIIRVNGQPKLWVWDREPVPGGPVTIEDGPAAAAAWRQARGGTAAPIPIRRDRSIPVAQALELPVPESPRDVRFGHRIRLRGADFPLASEAAGALAEDPADDPAAAAGAAPGAIAPPFARVRGPLPGDLGVTLLWEAYAPVDRDYSVFVHVVDAAGQTVAQSDGWPGCGAEATHAWAVGAVHVDPRVVDLPEPLPPGRYTVRAGLYDPATGERLPAREGTADHTDAATLWAFELTAGDKP